MGVVRWNVDIIANIKHAGVDMRIINKVNLHFFFANLVWKSFNFHKFQKYVVVALVDGSWVYSVLKLNIVF